MFSAVDMFSHFMKEAWLSTLAGSTHFLPDKISLGEYSNSANSKSPEYSPQKKKKKKSRKNGLLFLDFGNPDLGLQYQYSPPHLSTNSNSYVHLNLQIFKYCKLFMPILQTFRAFPCRSCFFSLRVYCSQIFLRTTEEEEELRTIYGRCEWSVCSWGLHRMSMIYKNQKKFNFTCRPVPGQINAVHLALKPCVFL
jgi:hypothetical protein